MFVGCGQSPVAFVTFGRCTGTARSTHVPVCYATPLQTGLGHECDRLWVGVLSVLTPAGKSFLDVLQVAGSPDVVLDAVGEQGAGNRFLLVAKPALVSL